MMKAKSLMIDVTKLPELDEVPVSQRNHVLLRACVAAMWSWWGLAAVVVAALSMALVYFVAVPMPYAIFGYTIAGAAGGHLWMRGIRAELRTAKR
jgi:hypothetical protein